MTRSVVDKSKITWDQSERLSTYGFKWYKDRCTDRVEPQHIANIYPTVDGFVVIYTDDCALKMSIAKVDHVEWRRDPSREWVYVHWTEIEDIKNPNWKD